MNFTQLSDEEKRAIFEQVNEDVLLPLASIEKDWWVVQIKVNTPTILERPT